MATHTIFVFLTEHFIANMDCLFFLNAPMFFGNTQKPSMAYSCIPFFANTMGKYQKKHRKKNATMAEKMRQRTLLKNTKFRETSRTFRRLRDFGLKR